MGCAWSEQPIYVQFAFMLDRVKALAAQHPEWTQKQPFKAVLDGDMKALAASGERGLLELMAATHVANTTEEFAAIVTDWIGTARHPKTGRPYTEMVYQPMLEVLSYLRANGFKTYVVSGGGVEFMRPWIERVYGIPPEQVVGSRAKVKYEVRSGVPVLFRLRMAISRCRLESDHVRHSGPRLGLLVHHTDAEREWAYDRSSHIGQLACGLDEAPKRGGSLWI